MLMLTDVISPFLVITLLGWRDQAVIGVIEPVITPGLFHSLWCGRQVQNFSKLFVPL